MHGTDLFLVHDWDRFRLSTHRDSPISDPAATPFSDSSHHRDPRANDISQSSGPLLNDDSASLHLASVA